MTTNTGAMFLAPIAYLGLCGLIGYAAFKWPEIRIRRNLRYVGFRQEATGDVVLEFETRDGARREYRGACTIWHTVPSGHRCSVQTRGFLYEIWTQHVWKDGADVSGGAKSSPACQSR